MSPITTPSWSGRGRTLPFIDTQQATLEKAQPLASCPDWPLTPPQSAHDSRRPSSTGYSTTEIVQSSGQIFHYSYLPTTPVNVIQSTDEVATQTWSSSASIALPSNFADTLSPGQALLRPADERRRYSRSLWQTGSTPPVHDLFANSLGAVHEHCRHPDIVTSRSLFYDQDVHCAMLQRSAEPGPESPLVETRVGNIISSIYCDDSQPYIDTEASHCAFYDTRSTLAPCLQQAIVPSQLTPTEGFLQQHSPSYATAEQSLDSINSSFESMDGSISDFETLRLPPPERNCFTDLPAAEWVVVDEQSPVSGGAPRSSMCGDRKLRRNKLTRAKKRSKSVMKSQTYESQGVVVAVDSKVPMDSEGRVTKPDPSKLRETKMFKCTCWDEVRDEPCRARFDRNEHRTRHESKHRPGRFKCPIEGCPKNVKAMTRFDNSKDHFKKHLNGEDAPKRTIPLDWPILKAALEEKWDEGEMPEKPKVVANLENWIRDADKGDKHAFQKRWLEN